MKAWETFVDVGLLLVQSLRHLLVRVRLDTQGFGYGKHLEQEGQIAFRRARIGEFRRNFLSNKLFVRRKMS